jgi:hypothetical protein
MSTAPIPTNDNQAATPGRRVALIAIWQGPFPTYFDLFLASCATNPDFTWLILSDQAAPADAPENVRFVPMSTGDVNRRIHDALGIETNITRAYKACDLRPMYGLLFADLLRDFTHWGHCDLDVIWGRLGHFLTADLFDRYPRLQESGHLSIYRNDDQLNRIFMRDAPGVPNWKTVLAHPDYSFYFDEWPGINRILQHHGVPRAVFAPVADVSAVPARYRLYGRPNHRLQAFSWQQGRVCREFVDEATGQIGRDEFAYIHLQKRRLPPPPFARIPDLGYWITPQGFVPRLAAEADRATIRAMNRPSWTHAAFVVRWRTRNLWRKLTGQNRPPA